MLHLFSHILIPLSLVPPTIESHWLFTPYFFLLFSPFITLMLFCNMFNFKFHCDIISFVFLFLRSFYQLFFFGVLVAMFFMWIVKSFFVVDRSIILVIFYLKCTAVPGPVFFSFKGVLWQYVSFLFLFLIFCSLKIY